MTDQQKNRGWNLQDWKMTDEVAGVEFAGLENEGPVSYTHLTLPTILRV